MWLDGVQRINVAERVVVMMVMMMMSWLEWCDCNDHGVCMGME